MDVKVTKFEMQKIGNRLRRLRLHLNYQTQTSFAEAVGLQRHRYVQYENGDRLLTVDAAAKIRAATLCPLDFMYFGDTHGLPASLRELANPPADAAA